MKTILFQGDSITNWFRDRSLGSDLGKGYPCFVAGRLGLDMPGEFQFLNRGVSGDRIVDIYARIKRDILNLKPDMLSILVGINDVWHELECSNGVDAKKFKKIYRMLLEEIMEALPDTKILLMEPFVLKGSATAANIDKFVAETATRAEAVRELALEFHLPFLPLQQGLNELVASMPEDYWLSDGVHPTVYFHQYIADKWILAFKEILLSNS